MGRAILLSGGLSLKLGELELTQLICQYESLLLLLEAELSSMVLSLKESLC